MFEPIYFLYFKYLFFTKFAESSILVFILDGFALTLQIDMWYNHKSYRIKTFL